MAFTFSTFHQRYCNLLVRLQEKFFERNESRPWLHVWRVPGKKTICHFRFSFFPRKFIDWIQKIPWASNFFLLKTESMTETVTCFGRKMPFKFALFKGGIWRKNEFLKVITVKTKKNFSRRKILRARWVYVLVVNLIYRESITKT